MSSTGTLAVTSTSYKTLFFQGAANMVMAHFAGTLRCLEHYKTESLAMAGLGTLAASLTQLLTQTTGKHDCKSFMLRMFSMGATIIGTSFALQKWSSVRALPFDRATRLVGLEFVAMGFVTVMAKRFGHSAPTRPTLSAATITIPSSAEDIERNNPLHISLYHEKFQSNKEDWRALSEAVRSAFIQLFFENGYGVIDPDTDGQVNADWLKLPETEEDVEKLSEKQMVWIYHMFKRRTKQFSDLPILVQHGFNQVFLNLEATGRQYHLYTVTLERLQEIEGHKKEKIIITRLHWRYRPAKPKRFDALTPQVQAHLNTRFAHHGLEQRPEHAERLGIFTPENIRALNKYRINEWYAVLSAIQVDLWNDLPLEKKEAFNAKFAQYGKELLPWGDFEAYPEATLRAFFSTHIEVWRGLDIAVRSRLSRAYLPLEIKVALNAKFVEFGKEVLPLGDIAAFPVGMNEAELRYCHTYLGVNKPAWTGLQEEVRAQFIHAFYTSRTLGIIDEETDGTVNSDWLVLPNSTEAAAALTDSQAQWLYHIFRKTDKFSTLPSILVQRAVNSRMGDVIKQFLYYSVD